MKRKIALALAMIMAAVSLTACGGGAASSAPAASGGAEAAVWTIGYSNRDDADVYLKAVQVAFKELVDADPALECLYADCALDSQTQLDQIDNFFVQGVDALVLVPQDGATVEDIVEQCNEEGLPVFCSSQAASGGEFVFVGASDYETGLLEGEWCYENLEEGAKILYLGGNTGIQTSLDRRQGLVDGLKDRIKADWDGNVLNEGGDIEILSWQETMYTMEEGMRITEDWIQTFDDFDCIVSVNDATGLGAVEALKGAGINDCTVVSIDGIEDALNAVKEGTMDVTIMQSAERQAQCLYDAIKTAQAGGENPAVINPELVTIDSSNIDEYI